MKKELRITLLAIILGLAAAYIDTIRTPFNLWLTASALFLFCFVLGFIQPDRAYASALIVGGSVLILFLMRRYIDSVSLNLLKAIPTLIPSFAGAYCGATLRRMCRRVLTGSN